MGFCKCFCYLTLTGTLFFLFGRLLSRYHFNPTCFPFCQFVFEHNSRLYERLKIQKWQNKVPDMSKIFPKLMPAKNLSGDYQSRLPVMVQETCIAELVHWSISLFGLYCLWLWPGIGGIIVTLIQFLLLNLPYILIQRYNRPRLLRLAQKKKSISALS